MMGIRRYIAQHPPFGDNIRLLSMERRFTLFLLAFATAACLLAAPAKKVKKTSGATAAVAGKVGRKTTARSGGTHTTGSKSTAKVTYVRGRRGKLVPVAAHAPAGPAYQAHPDPERYQQIQQALADKGYFKGEVNGRWGDDSVDALKRFQADQKLDDDGHLSALTLIGLGLGPKHDRDVSKTPTPVGSTVTNSSATQTGSSAISTPVVNSASPVGPPQSAPGVSRQQM
jgi:hypothetical protein